MKSVSIPKISYRLPAPTGYYPKSRRQLSIYQASIAQTEATTLSQLSWRYQSSALQSELGYGWSGFGRGANASIGMTVSPGLQVLGRYQGISAFTNQQSFSIEVQSTLDFQGGVRVANTRVEDLRTSGGIALQPFFDRNGNGKLDPGEESLLAPRTDYPR